MTVDIPHRTRDATALFRMKRATARLVEVQNAASPCRMSHLVSGSRGTPPIPAPTRPWHVRCKFAPLSSMEMELNILLPAFIALVLSGILGWERAVTLLIFVVLYVLSRIKDKIAPPPAKDASS